jgi:hypothetical protein
LAVKTDIFSNFAAERLQKALLPNVHLKISKRYDVPHTTHYKESAYH